MATTQVTTASTRNALQLLQTIVALDRAIDSSTVLRGQALLEEARQELAAVDAVLEGAGPTGEIRHTYAPSLGGVRVKYETNSRSTNVEVSVDRPREANETYDDAAAEAVEIAARARKLAFEAIEQPTMPISIIDGGKSA